MATTTPLDATVATLGSYQGDAGASVRRLKFAGDRREVRVLARGLTRLALVDGPPDVVTWVPTTAGRRGRRGFDQAEVLARATARALRHGGHRVALRRLLLRAPGSAQTAASGPERRVGPEMRVRTAGLSHGVRVVLVDDVVTTGTTMSVAARLLLEAGASTVVPVAVARTPHPAHRGRGRGWGPGPRGGWCR